MAGRWLGLLWIVTAIGLWGWQLGRGKHLERLAARWDTVIAEMESPDYVGR